MEDLLKSFWGMAATIVEGTAALLIAIGAAEAHGWRSSRFSRGACPVSRSIGGEYYDYSIRSVNKSSQP